MLKLSFPTNTKNTREQGATKSCLLLVTLILFVWQNKTMVETDRNGRNLRISYVFSLVLQDLVRHEGHVINIIRTLGLWTLDGGLFYR